MSKQQKNLNYKNKNWLYNQYIVQEKTIQQLAKEQNVGRETIRRALIEHQIERRKPFAHFKPKLGADNPMFGKVGKLNPFFGKKHTQKTKKIISNKKRGTNKGANNPSWKGGKTPLYEKIRKSKKYDKWRLSVYERDNFKCQNCGDSQGGNLNADHIVPFAVILHKSNIQSLKDAYGCEKLWDVENGRTLCETCHKGTDTWGYRTTKLIKQTNYNL